MKNLKLNFIGEHNYLNATGAVLVSKELGLSQDEIKRGLEKIKPEKGRLNILKGISGLIIIDDTYNASPVSMIAGIKAASGGLAKKYFPFLPKVVSIHYCEDIGTAVAIIKSKINPTKGDIILVKASQGIRLEKVVKEILQDPSLAQSLLVRQDERWKTP